MAGTGQNNFFVFSQTSLKQLKNSSDLRVQVMCLNFHRVLICNDNYYLRNLIKFPWYSNWIFYRPVYLHSALHFSDKAREKLTDLPVTI